MFSCRLHVWFAACLTVILVSGCGGSSETELPTDGLTGSIDRTAAPASIASLDGDAGGRIAEESTGAFSWNEAAAVTAQPTARVTAAISGPGGSDVTRPAVDGEGVRSSSGSASSGIAAGNEADEVSRLLAEIQQLRVGSVPADLEQARIARRDRNERIVEMATNVLRLTLNDSAREQQFHQAIGQLLEARFQLALAGDQDDVDQFYMDIQALNERDPKSPAAAEGVYYIARFAHTKAGLLGRNQPQWFSTLSKWAREFADRFPEQQQRAVSMLFGAGLTCELHAASSTDPELAARLMTDAKLCYTALAEGFADTTQGQKATATLRRLALAGQPLSQFSGPTLDGGFFSVDDLAGKPAIIYFWSSTDDELEEQWQPLLQKIRAQIPTDRLKIVGVALDEIESDVEAFLEEHPLPGPQIFFPKPEQRSWNSPLVRFWGINQSPTIWVIDSKGIVVSTTVTSAELVPLLQRTLK